MRTRTGLLILAIVVLALLALGGTAGAMTLTHNGFLGNGPGMMSGQYSNGSMMGGYQQNPARQGTPLTGVTQMNMQNYAYQMANIQVHTGTTVTWTNRDNVPHSITLRNGMKDSGLLNQGQSFSYTFNTPGTYQYYCTVHPYMVATVTVVS